jgi:hypothetical protein
VARSGDLHVANTRHRHCGEVLCNGSRSFVLHFRILARRPAVTAIATISVGTGHRREYRGLQPDPQHPSAANPGSKDPRMLVQFMRIEGGQTSGNLGYSRFAAVV